MAPAIGPSGHEPAFTFHIDSNGSQIGNRAYAGHIDRNFDGWTRLKRYRNNYISPAV